MKVLLYTNFYEFRAMTPYITSLTGTFQLLQHKGIDCEYVAVRGNFHVERILNESLSLFVKNDDLTDIFIVDYDVSWHPEDFLRILTREEEVLCATYRIKNHWDRYAVVLKTDEDYSFVGKIIWENTAILKALRAPAGFMRIRKSALQKFIEAYPDDYFEMESGKVYKFFWNEIKDKLFVGMDYAFCDKLRGAGVDIWVDPNAKVSHWGLTEYPGDLDKELRDLKRQQDGNSE